MTENEYNLYKQVPSVQFLQGQYRLCILSGVKEGICGLTLTEWTDLAGCITTFSNGKMLPENLSFKTKREAIQWFKANFPNQKIIKK